MGDFRKLSPVIRHGLPSSVPSMVSASLQTEEPSAVSAARSGNRTRSARPRHRCFLNFVELVHPVLASRYRWRTATIECFATHDEYPAAPFSKSEQEISLWEGGRHGGGGGGGVVCERRDREDAASDLGFLAGGVCVEDAGIKCVSEEEAAVGVWRKRICVNEKLGYNTERAHSVLLGFTPNTVELMARSGLVLASVFTAWVRFLALAGACLRGERP